jgi:tRNA A-37 threonylcarbamoyl transferase component Bud32
LKGSDQTTTGPISLSPEQIRWQALPAWRELLLDAQGLRLAEWLRTGQARIVKQGTHRVIYRLDLVGGSFFLKHYRCGGFWATARHIFRQSASRREYAKALELTRRDVPTVVPVACGEQHHAGLVGDNFLVTQAIPNAVSLSSYVAELLPQLNAEEQSRMQHKLALAMARLCATAHQAGVFHDDFHGGNVLLRLDTCHPEARDARLPELHLLDLPGVRLSGPLDERRTRASLVMLRSDWTDKVSDRTYWRFWRAYRKLRPDLRLEDPRAFAFEIIQQARDYACGIFRGRDKRALSTNRDFQALHNSQGEAHAVAAMHSSELSALLADPQRLLRENSQRAIKASSACTVVETELSVGGRMVHAAYKWVRPKRWWKKLLAGGRQNPTLEAWRLGHALLARGVATPLPLAVCAPRGRRHWGHGYLATEWLDGALNLHLYGWELAKREPRERSKQTRRAAESLGRLLGRMHGWNIAHRDLKGCNLVFVEHPDRIDALVLDMEAVRIRRRLRFGERARNLARLALSLDMHPWITRTDCLRFLRAYASQLAPSEPDVKRLWRAIEAGRWAHRRRFARRGKPVA